MNEEEMPEKEYPVAPSLCNQTNKSKLVAIWEILQINPNMIECPANGYSADLLVDHQNRSFE